MQFKFEVSMQRRIFAPLALAFGLLICLGVSEAKLRYLSPDSIDVVQLLPDPPDKNSSEQQQEIDLVLRIQQTRTDAEVARGKSEAKFTVFAFADVLGPWFTEENCPESAKFFKQVASESKYFSDSAKGHWNRPRPPREDNRVKPMLDENDASYPSGHSTRATAMAEILAEIFPQQKEALMARARQIGWDRVIVGVHFPSDVYAGRVLGHAIAHQLLAKSDFRSELEVIKTELLQASTAHTTAATP
jgi:acid phosphatase (class A)